MAQKEQQIVIYSDEASMASGNGNGDTLNPVASPSAMEEVSNVLVPQILVQLAPRLFDDWCIFISAPQYHWHVTEGYTEARQHIIALAPAAS